MSKISEITGVILAGGRSSRFGENKALATLHGIRLIDRVVDVMAPLFSSLLLVTNQPEEFARLNLPMVQDREPYLGPLGGLASALPVVSTGRVFVVACDMPILTTQLIREIMAADRFDDAVIPTHDGICEYLMAIYSTSILPQLEKQLREGRLAMAELVASLRLVQRLPMEGNGWFNVNTKAELQFLETHHAD